MDLTKARIPIEKMKIIKRSKTEHCIRTETLARRRPQTEAESPQRGRGNQLTNQ